VGDTVLGRFDVRPTLDGVEPGIWELRSAERRGVTVLNRADSLLLSHDKLASAVRLRRAGVPHPGRPTSASAEKEPFPLPVVLKPRFGTCGREVFLADSVDGYCRRLHTIRGSHGSGDMEPSFRRSSRHGDLTSASSSPAAVR
jgi:glutathione synthase/RimK-type ligase-like ATP-grasp enzyme